MIFSPKLFLSFGENCLTDNILDRHGVKSFTTIYSHGRSNIEYILQMEKDNHKDFLNLEFIKYEKLNDKLVPYLKTYNEITNSYNTLHMNGFEFTHHDVISNEALREKFQKRIDRLNSYKGKKKMVIFYHHRYSESTDMDLLNKHLSELKRIFSQGNNTVQVILFFQNIVDSSENRKVEYNIDNGIHTFIFHTLNMWEGDDQFLFWAKPDEDLIKKMISTAKSL